MAVSAFGGTARAAPVQAHTAPRPTRAWSNATSRKLEQVHIVLGVPSYPLAHERRYAASLLNIILGGGMSSRLFQNIRERQGLAYAIFSDVSPYTDSGVLSVYAGTSRETTGQLIPLRGGRIPPHKARGILIDWDLSKKVAKDGMKARQHSRTVRRLETVLCARSVDVSHQGTWQFISIARLQDPSNRPHEVSDDLESFFGYSCI